MSTAREFHTQQVHYLRKTVTFEDAGVAVKVGTIPAGSLISYTASGAHVSTAFSGTGTDLLDIGTSGTADLFASDLDVSAAGFKQLDNNVAGLLVTADTDIYATYTDTNADAGAGSAVVVIAYVPDNDG